MRIAHTIILLLLINIVCVEGYTRYEWQKQMIEDYDRNLLEYARIKAIDENNNGLTKENEQLTRENEKLKNVLHNLINKYNQLIDKCNQLIKRSKDKEC